MGKFKILLRTSGISKAYHLSRQLPRFFRRQSSRMQARSKIGKYLRFCQQNGTEAKLQVGASDKAIEGWLNTDYEPSGNAVFLDITKPLPFANEQIDVIVAEHVIEHVPKQGANLFLRECHRCLKIGGVLRISTPDVGTLCRYMNQPSDKKAIDLVKRHSRLYRSGNEISYCDFFNDINHFWGHIYLYNEEELCLQIKAAGFTEMHRSCFGASNHSQLQGIDRHQAGHEMNDLNLVVEAVR